MSDLHALISGMIDDSRHSMHTAFPAVITSINAQEQMSVNVKTLTPRTDNNGVVNDQTQIMNVPVVFPSTKTSMLSFPVNVGDIVLCVVAEGSLDRMKISTTSNPIPVSSGARFDASNAIAIPGLYPFTQNPNNPVKRTNAHSVTSACLTHNLGTANEISIELGADGNLVITTPYTATIKAKDIVFDADNSISLKASTMNIDVANSTWSGNYTMTGTATFNGVVFDTHTHSGVTSGSGNTGPVVE